MNVQESKNVIKMFSVCDTTNIGTRWKKWLKKFENYIVVANVNTDERKMAMLVHFAGDEVAEIL